MKGPITTTKLSMNKTEQSKDWPQILAILSATLTSLTCGILFSWPSPSIPILTKDKINYDITLEEASYLTVIPPLTATLTSPIFGKLTDTIGRKYTILFIAIPHILSWILIASSNSIWVFYVSRFFTGMGDSCLFAALPIYISEISTPKVRGTWGNAMTFWVCFGQFLINLIGGKTTILTAALIFLSVPILFLCTFIFVPESPYYYLMKGRHEDARNSLQKLRGVQNVDDELHNLQLDVERQLSESGTWKDLFTIESNRKALFAGIFLRASQQLSGVAAFSVYTQYIFEKAGGNLSASDSATIFAAALVVMNIFAACILDKLGRRLAMMFSLSTCSLVLFIEMAYFYIVDNMPEIDLSSVRWLPVAGLIMFVVLFQVGTGIVPTLMLGELFSQSIKAKGLCFLNVIFGLCVSSVTKLFQVFQTNFGWYAPFAFFGTCCIINTFLAYYFVPETKGKTLEEIQQSLKGNETKKNIT